MDIRKYYKLDDNLEDALKVRVLLNERTKFRRKYYETLKNVNLNIKNEGRTFYKVRKKDYIVVATRYDWAIANLVPSDMREELVSNTPKNVVFLTRGEDEWEAARNVDRNYRLRKGGRFTKNPGYVQGCLLIPRVLRSYPVYHLEAGRQCIYTTYDVKNDDVIINLRKPSRIITERMYKWRSNPKEDTTKYFSQQRRLTIDYEKRNTPKFLRGRNRVMQPYPDFYKDKLITLHNITNGEVLKIRSSNYYNEDSPWTTKKEWKQGYPKFSRKKEAVKLPNISIQKNEIVKPL
jgi:hypothetical protein